MPCADVGGRLCGCAPSSGPLAYATSSLLWVRGPCFLRLGVVVSAGPLILGLVRDSGDCPGLTGLLCARAVVPGLRCAFAASSLAVAWGRGPRSLRLGLRAYAAWRLTPDETCRCVQGASGALCLGRPLLGGRDVR